MAQTIASLGSLLLVLCLGSCGERHERHERHLRSLVGDGNLPQTEIDADETAEIRLVRSNDDAEIVLRITLTPADRLEFQRERIRFVDNQLRRTEPVVERADKVQIGPAEAAIIRKRLALFRPDRLGADGPFIMPSGCNFIFHNGSKAVVAFNKADGTGGLFILQESCAGRNAESLTNELRDVVALLPKTKAGAKFHW